MERTFLQNTYFNQQMQQKESVKQKDEEKKEKKRIKNEKKEGGLLKSSSSSPDSVVKNPKLKNSELESLLVEMGNCLSKFRSPKDNRKRNKKLNGGSIQII